MSVRVTLNLDGLGSAEIDALEKAWQDRASLHAELAESTERMLKTLGAEKAAVTHGTAERLGAKPTGHLAKAYQEISSEATAAAAVLLVPAAGRLRAAFGPYTLSSPTATGKQYYTIPVNGAAYGRRAGEFTDLFPLRVGPRQTLILARDLGGGRLETMYLLTKKVDVKEDPTLIPFDQLHDHATEQAQEWADRRAEEVLLAKN